MKFTPIAILGAATLAVAQSHNHHVHRHPARRGSPLRDRDAATTTTVPGPVVTVYELNGHIISAEDVAEGLADGKYVLVGETISSVVSASTSSTSTTSSTTTTPTPSPTPSTSTSAVEFIQSPSPAATSTYVPPPPSSTTAAAAPTSAAASSSSAGSSASSANVDVADTSAVNKEFPSGQIPCSTFPSAYGAVRADWLGLSGWTGVQKTPDYDLVSTVISYIETAISGSSCTRNSFCSYACPAGYHKSQWPKQQGSTGQSIGGLYCNKDGMLELSRSSHSQICSPGVGNVQAKNSLSQNVAICGTDYPGTESETIPLNVQPGATMEVTCPDASDYYQWEGRTTSAQYYINPQGVSVEDACQWGSAGSNIGNWAPVNMGVGKSTSGETFISLFPNAPTNPDGVLDYNIRITGGVSGDCKYSGGKFYNNGVESPSGCTVSVSSNAVYEFF